MLSRSRQINRVGRGFGEGGSRNPEVSTGYFVAMLSHTELRSVEDFGHMEVDGSQKVVYLLFNSNFQCSFLRAPL